MSCLDRSANSERSELGKMVACDPSRQWEEHVQRPRGKELTVSEELNTVRGTHEGHFGAGETGPDQAGAWRPESRV